MFNNSDFAVDGVALTGDAEDNILIGTELNDSISGLGGADFLVGLAGQDILIGGNQADVLFGDKDNDFLFGNLGDDILSGSLGNDLLDGGEGTDILLGGHGEDTLIGGQDADVLTLGAGRDTVIIDPTNSGIDRIRDYQDDHDKIKVNNLHFDDLHFSQLGTNSTLISVNNPSSFYDGQKLAILSNVDPHTLDPDDFVFNQAPHITNPETVFVAENQIQALEIHVNDAEDNELTYSITGGIDSKLFAIDAHTGAVTFKNAPNFEAPQDADGDNSYHLQITVTDCGGLTDVLDLRVVVEDIDEQPRITSSDSASVPENQTDAIDVDAIDPNGDNLNYTISGGVDSELFNIEPDTGVVTFKDAPDFEIPGDEDGDNIYQLQVTVSDPEGLTDVQDIEITVTDVVESSPPEITTPGRVSVPENQTSAVDVNTINPNRDDLVNSITGGADSELFNIDPDTGIVTFKDAPDFEIPGDADGDNIYQLQVTVADPEGLTDVQNIAITVTDVAENTAPVLTVPDTQTVAEDEVLNLAGITVADSDSTELEVTLSVSNGVIDLAVTDGLTFTVGSGVAESSFTFTGSIEDINNALESLTYLGATDFNGADALEISVSDGEFTENETVDLVITPVEDEPPEVTIDDLSVLEGNSDTSLAEFTVSLSQASSLPVTIDYSTEDDTALVEEDYLASSRTLTFEPGETTKTFSVTIIGDTLDELDETFNVRLSNPVNAVIADELGTGTIIDDDESAPPILSAALANDTGISNSDNLTLDPTISGQVSSELPISRFEVSLNGDDFVDLTDALNDDGSFTIGIEEYEQLTDSLPDGEYTLVFKTTNEIGTESDEETVIFTLDRTAPPIELELAPESDTGELGDNITTERTVSLIGATEPDLAVVLVNSQQEVTSDSDGNLNFTDESLSVAGDKLFTAVTEDAAGNQGRANLTVAREGVNGAPEITSTPLDSISSSETEIYTYQVEATDPDGDDLSYTLLDAPLDAEIDEDGLLSFELPENPLPNYEFTVEVSDGRGGTDVQTFTVDVTDAVLLGSISGTKWNDLDGDGVRDADEPGLAGVSVYLDENNNGILDAGEPVQVTSEDDPSTLDVDETGEYSFTELTAATYIVREVVPNGFEQTFPASESYTIDLAEGEVVNDVDFGNQEVSSTENTAPEFISNPITEFFAAIPSTPDGNVDPSLITLNVNENTTETVSLTLGDIGSGTEANGADIVFVVDESRSMAGEQAWLTQTILDLDAALRARGIDDNRYSLIGFADSPRILSALNQPDVSIYGYGNQLIDTFSPSEGSAEFILPSDGDYTVVLNNANGQAVDYDLSFEIENREEITPTGFEQVYSQTIDPNEEQTFTFEASAGLKIYFDSITSSSSQIRGELIAPSGEIIESSIRSDTDSPFTLEETGTYTLIFNGGSAGGDYSYRLLNLSNVPTISLDTLVSGNLDLLDGSQAFKIEGTIGQRLYINSLINSSARSWILYGAENNVIDSGSFSTDLETVLPDDGTYWLVLDWEAGTDSEYSFQIVTPETTIETIEVGETVSGTINQIGDEIIYEFAGNAGDAIWFDGIARTSSSGPRTEIYAPDGERILSSTTTDNDRGIFTLSETGFYSVIVRSDDVIPGDYTFRILNLDDASSIEIGESVSASLSPGKGAQFFNIESLEGQKLLFDSSTDSSSGSWNLYSPGNEQIIRNSSLEDDFEVVIPSDGTYHLAITGNESTNIDLAFQVVNITPAEVTETGFNEIISGSVNGEDTETFTFNGNAGQRIFFDGLGSTDTFIRAALVSPSGDSIFSSQRLNTDNGVFVLPDTGTYSLTVDGNTVSGDFSFRILDLDNADLVELDTQTTINIGEGLGTQLYQFEGIQGTSLFFDSQTSAFGSWQLYFPGTGEGRVTAQSLSRDFTTLLPADGTYTLAISNSRDESIDPTFNIVTPEIETTAINLGEVVNGSLGEPGEIDSYTFTGTVGQKIILDGLVSDSTDIEARLISPTNNLPFGDSDRVISPIENSSRGDRSLDEDTETITLTEDGIYTLRVSGGDITDDYSFQIIDINQAEVLSNGDRIQGTSNIANSSKIFRIEDGLGGQKITISASPETLFADADRASDNTLLFSTNRSGREDGYLGLNAAVNLPFREGAAVNLILISDEERTVVDPSLSFSSIFNGIAEQNALLNSINNIAIDDSDGNTSLGVDSANNTYVADGTGGFNSTELGDISVEFRTEPLADNFTTIEDYVNLALATGGAAWDLIQLRDGGLSATSFTEAFVAIKAEEITQQLAIDTIISSPDVTFENLTGQVTGVGSGETATFDVSFTTDNQVRSFDLQFVRPNTDTVLGSIPVVVNEVYDYDSFATDADGDVLTYSLLESPDGAAINPQTGEITWGGATPGTYSFTLQVEDGRGGSDTQTFELTVTGTESQEFAAISGQKWEDINGDGVRDADEPGLAGVTVYLDENNNGVRDADEPTRTTSVDNPATSDIDETGQYSFGNLLPGEYTVREVVTEDLEQTFPIEGQYTFDVAAGETVTGIDFGNKVVAVNQLPFIFSTPITRSIVDTEYSYNVRVNDPDGDSLTYTLLTAPDGMSINDEGLITWNPDALGTFTVEVEVSDGRGGTTTQSYEITVLAAVEDTEDPTVNLGFNSSVLDIGETLDLQIRGFDNVAIADLDLSINGTSLALTPDVVSNGTINTAAFSSSEAGLFEVVATAIDTAGNTDIKTQEIRFIDPSDTEAPFIEFDTSNIDVADPVIRNITDLLGTVTDDNLESYRVELAPTSTINLDNPAELDQDYILLAEGDSNVVDGELAEIDPFLFRNDSYYVRVYAQDFSGNISVQGLILGIETPNKPGEFSQEFVDLSIPLTGVPIEVTRSYSSLDSIVEGDFGFGWSLGLDDAQIIESSPNGTDLTQDSFFGGNTFTVGTRVTLNTPDGRRVGFTFQPEIDRVSLLGAIYRPVFVPDPGVFDTLEVPDFPLSLRPDGTVTPFLFAFSYNPREYTLTTRDGTRYTYEQTEGLQAIVDRNGNTLTYSDDGIESSTGASIEFVRDAQGRIEQIIDPEGNAIEYNYDANGDLVGIIDREENETILKYESERPHYLTEIVDPLGRSGTRVEYGDDGRISRFIDADGNALELDFGNAAEFQTIDDPLGNTTTLFYDERGNVVRQVDALGGETVSTYDEDNNVLTRTDAEGNTTAFTYDGNGNVLTETDGEGNTTTFTYNEFSQVLTTTNANGDVATNIYDGEGNLLSTIDAEGNTIAYDYDDNGNLTQQTDENGNITDFGYNTFGLLTSITQELDGEELVSDLGYDNNGNLTSITTPEGRTTTFAYDDENRLVSATDPASNTSTIEYDAAGQRVATVDALGRRTEFEYNDRGLLTKTIFADGTEEVNQYDILDRLIATTNPNGDTTEFEYNALDELIAVVDAANNRTTYGRDLVGNLISQTDALNRTTTYTYDDANRLLTTQLPLGQTFTNTYDAVGNIVSTNDFNGDILNYDYDGLGQLLEISTSDSSVLESFTYSPTGQIATINDERGLTTFTYDELDRLTQRTDPDNSFIAYTYDGGDNITSLTTPSGTVGYSYDAVGFLDTVTERDGSVTDYDYDAVGNLTQTTFGNGVVETATYDVLNRIEELTTTDSDGSVLASYEYTFDNLGNRLSETDNIGRVTNYEYNESNQVTEVAVTDANLGDETTSYEYDAAGNVTKKTDSAGETTYTYDDNDRLISEESNGQVITYNYDDAGNRIDKRINGIIVEVYDWNIQGELASATITRDGNTTNTEYEYNSEGIRVSETVDGVQTNFLIDNNQQEFAQVIEEYTPGGIIQVSYTHGLDLISQVRGSDKGYYHTDSLGSTRFLTNETGNVINTYLYDAYGSIINQTEILENSYKYTGEQFDNELENYYLRARYYNPVSGRFVSRDSFEGFLERPLSLNDYLYAEGNPINAIDPSGNVAAISYISTLDSSANQAAFFVITGLQTFGSTNLIFIGNVLSEVSKVDARTDDFLDIALRETKRELITLEASIKVIAINAPKGIERAIKQGFSLGKLTAIEYIKRKVGLD